MDKNKTYSIFNQIIDYGSIESVLATCSIIYFINRYFAGHHWTVVNTIQLLSMWVFYLLDHLLDSLKTRSTLQSNSVFFFKKNFNCISCFLIILIVSIIYLLTYVDIEIIYFGLVILFFCVFYFIFINSSKFPKEFFAALIFTLGCLGPVLNKCELNYFMILSFIILNNTVLLNMILINILEFDQDQYYNQKSLAINFGLNNSNRIFILIYIFQLVFSGYLILKFLPYSWQLLFISTIYIIIFIINKYNKTLIKRKIIDYAFLFLLFF